MNANDEARMAPRNLSAASFAAAAFALAVSVAAGAYPAAAARPAAEDGKVFQEVISRIDDVEYCLTLDGDKVSAALEKCDGTDAQQWAFVQGESWLFISSKLLPDTDRPMCLGVNTQKVVKMMTCEAAGVGGDFHSMRRWRWKEKRLRNLYVEAINASANFLQSDEFRKLKFGTNESASSVWDVTRRYGHIMNVATSANRCLAVSSEKKAHFEPCADISRQDWRVAQVSTDSRFLKIMNRSLMGMPKEMWLDRNAQMVDFDGPGYYSTRSWSFALHFDPRGYTWRNKYWIDSGQAGFLGYDGETISRVDDSGGPNVVWNMELGTPDFRVTPYVGDRKLLLVHAHYAGEPSDSVAFDKIKQTVFGGDGKPSFVDAVRAASLDQLRFTGDAVSDIDIGPRPSDCPYSTARAKALEEAGKKGFNPAEYDQIAVALPSNSACKWGGIASSPGRWMMGNGDKESQKPHMWFHEFGHNLGAAHARSIRHCDMKAGHVELGSEGCTISNTFWDPSDVMGAAGLKLYPAPYLYASGWIGPRQFKEVVADGTYELAPLFGNTGSDVARAIYLFREDNSYLTLEFRRPMGDFENWPADSPFVLGVVVRVVNFSGGRVSNLLVDTTPGNDVLEDAPLMPGHALDDLLSGKRITVVKVTATTATVKIEDIPHVSTGRPRFERPYAPPEAVED